MPAEPGFADIVYYNAPTSEERDALREMHDIDHHSLAAALDPDEVPRVEFSPSGMNLYWKRPTSHRATDQVLFNVSSVGIFQRQDRLVIVVNDDHCPVTGSEFKSVTTFGGFILRMLQHTLHHYFEHLKVIKLISKEMQDKLETSMENKYLLAMFRLGESLTYYLNALESDGAVLKKIQANPEKLKLTPDDLDLLDDLLIDHEQCRKLTEIYDTVLAGLMDTRSGVINNNMNVLLKNLTIINVVFLPLNLLAGFFGMSEYTAMVDSIPRPVAYGLAFLGMCLVGWLTWWFLSHYVAGESTERKKKR